MARRDRRRNFIEPPGEEEKKSEVSYMQPEIMPVHIMEAILKEKGFGASIISKADRKMMVKYFYKHVSPKFQRDYRDNRRGKILKKSRQRREKKIEEEDWKKLVKDPKDIKASSHYSSSSSRDRLKPPPSSSSVSAPKSLDDIVINVHRSKTKDKDTDKEKGKIGEDSKRKGDSIDSSPKKIIKLGGSSVKRPSEEGSSENGKKIKLKRDVGWP